jgi:hypothetical protein
MPLTSNDFSEYICKVQLRSLLACLDRTTAFTCGSGVESRMKTRGRALPAMTLNEQPSAL